MAASRDARAEVYTDVSAIIGPLHCVTCQGAAVQKVVDVCSSTYHIGETDVGYVASFPGEHLKDAFAAPRLPEEPELQSARNWFLAAGFAVLVMAGVYLWDRSAGFAASSLPIACLAIGSVDFRRERYAALSFRTAKAWHEEELRFWSKVCYCHECGVVFVPGINRAVAPDQWRKLMV